jgi:hypothetical protein
MGDASLPEPVALIVAAFSRCMEALDWGRAELERVFGPVALASPLFEFNQTKYYELTMGPELRKRFLVFDRLVDAHCLADVKRLTNDLEAQLAGMKRFPEVRPLNLDPGILTLGKLLLATTKDQAHRIYLRDGIYAEVTLRFQDGNFVPWPWTYADYREPALLAFLKEARDWYREQIR